MFHKFMDNCSFTAYLFTVFGFILAFVSTGATIVSFITLEWIVPSGYILRGFIASAVMLIPFTVFCFKQYKKEQDWGF